MLSNQLGRIRWLLVLIIVVILLIYFGYDSLFRKTELQKNEVGLYFVKNGALVLVKRTLTQDEPLPQKLNSAISELLKGPNLQEKTSGYSTVIPRNVQLKKAAIVNGLAHLDFSKELANYGGGTATVQTIIGQIVYTATEFKEIKKVKFFIEGKDEEIVLGGEGFIIDKPLGRNDLNL